MKIKSFKYYILQFLNFGILPVIFYFICFYLLTYPLIHKFLTHLFTDMGDGLQNVWNLWWVNKSITELHQSPWYTTYLHYPYGTSLLGHTLNLHNGIIGIFLMKVFTLSQTYNTILIFSFVTGGLTAFLLAYYVTRSYIGSIIAGYIFTFSNYHFAHAEGHLQLVSLEWIPLFVLFFHILMTKPHVYIAILSGLVLYLILLCDYYYFFYCILSGAVIFLWYLFTTKNISFIWKKHIFPLAVFCATVFLTAGPIVISLFLLNRTQPFLGYHLAQDNSLDLLSLFIPGGHWQYANLTKWHWSRLSPNIHETSVHLGISIIFLLVYTYVKRRKIKTTSLSLWYTILLFFLLNSLGPNLYLYGKSITYLKMPYYFLEKAFPFLELSGCPIRMIIMVILAASIVSAIGFKMLFEGSIYRKLLALTLLLVLLFEYLPKPIPCMQIPTPEYVKTLINLPDNAGLLDTINNQYLSLYYQTLHKKPMAFGYISRIPKNVLEKDLQLQKTIQDNNFELIYNNYNIRYILLKTNNEIKILDILTGNISNA